MATSEPTIFDLRGLSPLSDVSIEDMDWERRVYHPVLTLYTVAMAGAGLVAQAIPQAPPAVSWAFVALSAVGAFTLAARLLHSYLMSKLEVERHRAENAALKAEIATYRAVRRGADPSEN